ncbi:MAG: E3 ubiquitin-protein ligase bre1 [Caeruleum heppii]|nr:MAG: E3 ubiquitin-protein ligase bre1 [Caeruleum heppii]
MHEYKREKNNLEHRVSQMLERATYHDDHLRIIDAWWEQLLDEVKILAGETANIGQAQINGDSLTRSTSLLFNDVDSFQKHLVGRSKDIKATISEVFKMLPETASPDVAKLQDRVSALLAAEKGHHAELDRVRAERDQLEERLENASLRYMMAEKKAERARSAAVAKLERQAIFGGGNEAGSGLAGANDGPAASNRQGSEAANGLIDSGPTDGELELARKEAAAVSEKQTELLKELEETNEKLNGQVTTLALRLSNLNDDDYARSDLFRHMKSQYEDVIKRINNLEATNVQLREEAEKLQVERTAHRARVENEVKVQITELESQLVRSETDLARIRATRDELTADNAIRKASQERENAANDYIKELVAAREERIKALESEIERLHLQLQPPNPTGSQDDLDCLTTDELKGKYRNLQKENSLLSSELPSMGLAWKKASVLASKKVMDTAALEEKISRLQAEKTKADQKYFATMKLKEARDAEVRTYKAQNAKSSEIIAQLKEVDASTRQLVVNLERSLVETKDALRSVTSQSRNLQHQVTQSNITVDTVKTQVNELSLSMKDKDVSFSTVSKAQRVAEIELQQLRVRLEDRDREVKGLMAKAAGNQSDEFESLRTLALCAVCKSRFKNTALKLCGHLFCKECVEERIGARSRKCPNCSRAFGTGDVMPVHL